MSRAQSLGGEMPKVPSLNELWESTPPGEQSLGSGHLAGVPDAARRYLEHAIAPGTRLASAVRLQMHGQIKLKRWFPFKAEQVISAQHGMIWMATVRMYGIPIRGFDRLIDSEGAMRWKLLGVIPIITASGRDIMRSAAGRLEGESLWLPSMLCNDNVSWPETDSSHLHARFTMLGETADIQITIDDSGRLKSVKLPRWGNPDGTKFRYENFGGFVEEEAKFGGYTIPSRLRLGWYFDTDRFESEGEFFRVTIDSATYR